MSGIVINVPLDATARDVIVSLVYRAWSDAFDNLKLAKSMEFDRKVHCDRESYEGMKADCIKNATETLAKLKYVLDSVQSFSPLIRGE